MSTGLAKRHRRPLVAAVLFAATTQLKSSTLFSERDYAILARRPS